MSDLLAVALMVAGALERAGARYTIGGSLASSFSGEPRASIDVDVVVDLTPGRVGAFVEALGDAFYVDSDALDRATRTGTSTNLLHHASGAKVDVFVAASPLDHRQLERRQQVQVGAAAGDVLFVHSPEDILIQKLHWYRLGGETSERQWRDVLGILLVQGSRLDQRYLVTSAAEAGIEDLLVRARREAGQADDS